MKEVQSVSIIFSNLTVATVLDVPLATFISDMINWQSSFLLTAFINIVAAAGVQTFLSPIEQSTQTVTISKRKVLNNRLLWMNVLFCFFTIAAMYSTYGYMADFLKTVTQMNGKQISLMLLLFGFI